MTKAAPWIQPIIDHRQPMQPIPTQVTAQLKKMPGVRAVIFDVYGTLVTSGSGDVGAAMNDAQSSNPRSNDAMAEAIAALPTEWADQVDSSRLSAALFRQLIQSTNDQARRDGIECPEVDIVAIWRQFLIQAGAQRLAANTEAVVRLATQYEARANPTWPMPGAKETLGALRLSGAPLGIVSNAQIFTPAIVKNLTQTRSLSDAGFRLDLCLFSNRFRQSKPGVRLFDVLAPALARHNLTPQEAIYVGNDMLNDVYAASVAGLTTAWFAGDLRSCRPRRDDPRVSGLKPDLVLTELPQLLECVRIH